MDIYVIHFLCFVNQKKYQAPLQGAHLSIRLRSGFLHAQLLSHQPPALNTVCLVMPGCARVCFCVCVGATGRRPTNQRGEKGGHGGAGGGIRDGAHTPEPTERIGGGESQGRRVIKERRKLEKNRQREERGSTRQSLVRGQEHRSV